jgi:hypothetical protein
MSLSIPSLRKLEFVGRRLHNLGRHLGDMSDRVRMAVVEAIRATVADMARDAVDQVLLRRGLNRSTSSYYHHPRDDYDPWDDDQPHDWPDRMNSHDEDFPVPDHGLAQPRRRSAYGLAVALAAAGWWLRQQGTVLGAFGVAVVAAAAASLTKRLAWDGMPLAEAAYDLLNLHRCLSAVATLLTKS